MVQGLQELAITLPGMARDDVYVESVTGREALGECYAFSVDVISRHTIDIASLVGLPAKLEITVV